jgi:membrane protease YdiL (CAAX protease family)
MASVAFGAIHAVTPLYFVFATFHGLVLGVEYISAGLPAAAITHWLYDWLALESQLWLARGKEHHSTEQDLG